MQYRIKSRIAVRLGLSAAAAAAILSGVFACTEETAGESIEFDTGVVGASSTGGSVTTFTNSRGWTVELSTAKVAVGPVYFYSAEPYATLFDRVLGIRVAHACPSHAQYDRGTVLGEVLNQYAVDLLSGEVTSTGLSAGESGTCRMFELHLHPPGDVPAGSPNGEFSSLQGFTAYIAGTASKDADVIPFEGGMTVPDEGTMRIVESIPASVALRDMGETSGRAVVEVYLDQWLTNVDFSSLPEAANDAPRTFTEDSQAYTAWLTGIRSRFSYGLSWRN